MGVRKNRGLTLIELCIAMALVAILASLGVPTFRAAARNAAVRSAVFELAADLQLTRSSAILQAHTGALCLSRSPGSACLSGDSATAWTAYLDVDGAPRALSARALPAGIVLHATRSRLTFWPDSRGASTGTLTICDALGIARPRALVVSQPGRIRLAEGDPADCRT
jgi:type IV fimbrial biogenesis protein FimT